MMKGVYEGVDVVYHGDRGRLQYDFVVAPGADPDQVQLAWEGVESLEMNAEGGLVLETRLGEVVQKQPRVYQEINGERVGAASGL